MASPRLFVVCGGPLRARGSANDRDREWTPRVSPDGHWVAYASDESGSYPVYVRPFPGPGAQTIVVLNWTDELRAAVAKGVRGSLRD